MHPPADDLISILRSSEGERERERLLKRLDELDARVQQALRVGQARGPFEDLEAVRLAVAAARDTLTRLSLNAAGRTGALQQGLPVPGVIRPGVIQPDGVAVSDGESNLAKRSSA